MKFIIAYLYLTIDALDRETIPSTCVSTACQKGPGGLPHLSEVRRVRIDTGNPNKYRKQK